MQKTQIAHLESYSDVDIALIETAKEATKPSCGCATRRAGGSRIDRMVQILIHERCVHLRGRWSYLDVGTADV